MMSYNFLVIFYGSQLKFYTKPRTFYSPGLHFFMIKEAVAIATAPFSLGALLRYENGSVLGKRNSLGAVNGHVFLFRFLLLLDIKHTLNCLCSRCFSIWDLI